MGPSVDQETKANVSQRLIEIINQMTFEQQSELLMHLEDKSSRSFSNRCHERKSCFTSVDYMVNDRFFRDFIKDISAGGLFIETRKKFSKGEAITMIIMLPNYDQPLKVIGEVVRVVPAGVGVRFDPEQMPRELLEALMKSL